MLALLEGTPNAHDLTSSLGLIGNSFRLPGKNQFLQTDNRFWKKSGFNIPSLHKQNENKLNNHTAVICDKVVHHVLSPIYAIVRR